MPIPGVAGPGFNESAGPADDLQSPKRLKSFGRGAFDRGDVAEGPFEGGDRAKKASERNENASQLTFIQ